MVLESQQAGGTLLKTAHVESWPGDTRVTGVDLAARMLAHAQQAGAIVKEGVGVSRIAQRPDGLFHVRTDVGDQALTRAVIVTAGGSPKRLGLPGEASLAGRGISWSAVRDAPMTRSRLVYVQGGSDSAVEEAAYLATFARHVVLVHRGEHLTAAKVLQERLRAVPNVRIQLQTTVAAVEANAGGVLTSLTLRHTPTGRTERVPADWLFECIGFTPNTGALPPHVRHDAMGFIITDHRMATDLPGLFAAGAVRSQYVRHVTTAVGDGTTAAVAAQHYIAAQKELERHIDRAAEIMQEITH